MKPFEDVELELSAALVRCNRSKRSRSSFGNGCSSAIIARIVLMRSAVLAVVLQAASTKQGQKSNDSKSLSQLLGLKYSAKMSQNNSSESCGMLELPVESRIQCDQALQVAGTSSELLRPPRQLLHI